MRVNCFLKLYLLLYRQRKYSDTPEGIRTGIAVCTTLHVWSRSIVPGPGNHKNIGVRINITKSRIHCACCGSYMQEALALRNFILLCRIHSSFAEFVSALLKLYEF